MWVGAGRHLIATRSGRSTSSAPTPRILSAPPDLSPGGMGDN